MRIRAPAFVFAFGMALLSQGAARAQTQAIGPATTPAPAVEVATNAYCSAPRDMIRFKASLPNLARTLAKGDSIDIIALGSSSTAGSGSSSQLASYPARLDAELDRRFPGKDFRVANNGTGGLLARDMLDQIHARIADMPSRPALVLWQTGVNDAIQDVGVEEFKSVLERGVLDLRASGIDVVLVDMQYFPRSERVAVYGDYLGAMRAVAEQHKVAIFSRYAVMKHLVKSGQHTPEQLLAPDNFHLNDLTYGCLADLMADSIEEQLKGGRQMQAKR